MLTQSFNRLYSRLVTSFGRYHDVPRSPDAVAAIGSARIELDLARDAIASERESILAEQPPVGMPKRTAVSEDDLGRLRAYGTGYVSS